MIFFNDNCLIMINVPNIISSFLTRFACRYILVLLFKICNQYKKNLVLRWTRGFSFTAKCLSMYECVVNNFETSNVYFIVNKSIFCEKMVLRFFILFKTTGIVIVLMILTQKIYIYSLFLIFK